LVELEVTGYLIYYDRSWTGAVRVAGVIRER
jgi:hypothetical protein